jgi:Thiamine pyrophosphate enzyme, N-terminal TPP binding domain/Alpha-acetolactate decarboxylase
LVDAAKDQAEFEFSEIEGTLVGLWSPGFSSAFSIPGYNFHFLSDDRRHGGHLLECSSAPLRLRREELTNFHLALPENESFLKADLSKNAADELAYAEQALWRIKIEGESKVPDQPEKQPKNGAEVVVRTLESHGVEYVFGIPGAKIDAVFNALVDSKIRTVVCRHEQNAAFIAGGIGRMTGKAGVAIATSGPGVSNLVTGLATANSEGDPLVALGGAVATDEALKQIRQTMDSVPKFVKKGGCLTPTNSRSSPAVSARERLLRGGPPPW